MIKELVFIPIARSELAAIDGSVLLTGRATHRVIPELLAALEYTADQGKDTKYAAPVLTSVATLTEFGERLVLVVDVDTSLITSGDGPENGACVLTRIASEAMTCWSSKTPGVDVSAAVTAIHGLDINTAWGFDEV